MNALRAKILEIWHAMLITIHNPAVQRGLLGSSFIGLGAFTPAFLPGSNPLREDTLTALAQDLPGRSLWTAVLLLGVALLLDAWLRLRPGNVANQHVDLRGVFALWTIPLLLVPPLFSNDAYSYAAQGWMIHVNMNPYEYGPASAPGPFQLQVDHYWKGTPAPYGPLGLQIQRGVVELAQHAPFRAAVMMRIPAIISVAAVAHFLPRVAEHFGGNRRTALWLGVINPLVMMHQVGGSHNDSIMIAGMVIALWLATKKHFILALALAGVAAAVKQPAAIALAPIAMMAMIHYQHIDQRPFTTWMAEIKRQPRIAVWGIGSTLVTVASFVAVSLATGLNFGWIAAMSVPGEVRTPLAPATIIGYSIESLLYAMNLDAAALSALPTVRTILSILGGVAMVILWLRFGRTKPLDFVAWGLIAFALTSPALHAWYMLWGGTLFAATKLNRTTMSWAIWFTAILVCYSAVDASFRNGNFALPVTAIAATLWVATGRSRRTTATATLAESTANADAAPEGAQPSGQDETTKVTHSAAADDTAQAAGSPENEAQSDPHGSKRPKSA